MVARAAARKRYGSDRQPDGRAHQPEDQSPPRETRPVAARQQHHRDNRADHHQPARGAQRVNQGQGEARQDHQRDDRADPNSDRLDEVELAGGALRSGDGQRNQQHGEYERA